MDLENILSEKGGVYRGVTVFAFLHLKDNYFIDHFFFWTTFLTVHLSSDNVH